VGAKAQDGTEQDGMGVQEETKQERVLITKL